ncbi:hypothetical protein TDB9533_00337 [Thalassocella blandensis]|nr:hypothetical protein TDB9533_00337 [Thalassocella blandensis]
MGYQIKACFICVLAVGLASCSFNQDHSDLNDYIASVKSKPAGAIEPLPAFRPFEAYIYSAASIRSPFDRPIDIKLREVVKGKKITPDFNRPKEYLESFDIGSLTMVGHINRRGTLWALLSDKDGVVHWVKPGNFIGKNHGRIIATTENKIELIEIVSDGLDGWVERPRVIALSESKAKE